MIAPSVLIMDDDDSIRTLLSELMTQWGYNVAACRDGSEGLIYLADHDVDLILLDLIMTLVDGEDFLRLRHLFNSRPDMKVIIVTADRRAEQHLAGLRYDRIVQKPFDLDELLLAVRS